MDVSQLFRDGAHGVCRMASLDVGVKRVEMHSNIVCSDLANESGSVFLRIQEISFEAIQRFDAECNPKLLALACGSPKTLHRPLSFLIISPVSRQNPKTGVKRPADQSRSEFCCPFHAAFEKLDAVRANFRLGAYQVRFARQHATSSAFELQPIENLRTAGMSAGSSGARKSSTPSKPQSRMRESNACCCWPTRVVQTIVITPYFIYACSLRV